MRMRLANTHNHGRKIRFQLAIVHIASNSAFCMVKFLLAPMGVLTPGSAHSRPSAQPPIDTIGIFLAQVSGRGSKHLKISKHFSFFSEKNNPRGRWGPQFLFTLNIFFL